MNTSTPRTDARQINKPSSAGGWLEEHWVVDADFARKLEQELNEKEQYIERMKLREESAITQLETAQQELNEAKSLEGYRNLGRQISDALDERDECRNLLMSVTAERDTLKRERDEAQRQQEAKVTPALIMDYAKVQAERDQLRKVADHLADSLMLWHPDHGLLPNPALMEYIQLPHVLERKPK